MSAVEKPLLSLLPAAAPKTTAEPATAAAQSPPPGDPGNHSDLSPPRSKGFFSRRGKEAVWDCAREFWRVALGRERRGATGGALKQVSVAAGAKSVHRQWDGHCPAARAGAV